MDQQLLKNAKHIPYVYSEEKNELQNILDQTRDIREIQEELASIIDIQDVDIQQINDTSRETVDLAVNANVHLEAASGKKFKFTPLMLGGTLGALSTLPVTLGVAATTSIIGYAAIGGGLLGIILGKKLA
jgi:hypothetical protein|tara:strand:+ start:831 stop:1220 length:390 start_codon:yes stop_codon:yes gene_type:complete